MAAVDFQSLSPLLGADGHPPERRRGFFDAGDPDNPGEELSNDPEGEAPQIADGGDNEPPDGDGENPSDEGDHEPPRGGPVCGHHQCECCRLVEDYKLCSQAYLVRDEVVSREFFYLVQMFAVFSVVSSAASVAVQNVTANEDFQQLYVSLVTGGLALGGLIIMLAYIVNLESKASSKEALRNRMEKVEQRLRELVSGGLYLQCWYVIGNRQDYRYLIERTVKESGGKSLLGWFFRFLHIRGCDLIIIACRVLAVMWILFATGLVYFSWLS